MCDILQEGVLALLSTTPIVAYITVRPQSVIAGTRTWLLKHGFPDLPILAKPEAVNFTEGNPWKARSLGVLWPYVTGIVDDNPGVLKALPLNYPGVMYLFGHTNSPHLELRTDMRVYHCCDWPTVVETVQQNMKLNLLGITDPEIDEIKV